MFTREPSSSANGELLNMLGAPRIPELPKSVAPETFLSDGVYRCKSCGTIYCLHCNLQYRADQDFCDWQCRDSYSDKHPTSTRVSNWESQEDFSARMRSEARAQDRAAAEGVD